MIYLAHPDNSIAACESATSAEACEARGFKRCTYAEYKWLWRRKDARAGRALWRERAETQARMQTAPLGAVSGWTRYGIDGEEIKQ